MEKAVKTPPANLREELLQKARTMAEMDAESNEGEYLNSPYKISVNGEIYIARLRPNKNGSQKIVIERPARFMVQEDLPRE